ncbi:MAG: urease accessory UreF family protein [Pseudomonadota bacterium]
MDDLSTNTGAALAGMPGELLIWLSPAFPVGSFAYSQGLETAIAKDWVSDKDTLTSWLRCVMVHGALRNDLILLALITRARTEVELAELKELSAALQPSAERAKEACDQGQSFWAAYQAAWSPQKDPKAVDPGSITLTAAVGLAARDYDMETMAVLESFALAFVGNQISAAIRLGAVGQFDGQRITADLLPDIRALTKACALATLDDLGTATFGSDLASLFHETQTTRLFRS